LDRPEFRAREELGRLAGIWGAAVAWITGHGADLRLAVRVTVAGVASYALARLLGLAQGYWAVFTAVIVMQASLGGSLKATFDRLIGTLGGAVFGGAVALVLPHGEPAAVALALAAALLPLAFVAAIDPRFRVAPVTAVIVLISPFGQPANPLAFTLDRIVEIGLGSAVAVAVALVILPARAHGLLAEATGKLVELLAEFLGLLIDGLTRSPDKPAIFRLQVATRRTLAKLETIADEARRERASRFTDDPDPDPIVRTSLRVRNDLIMIARAAMEPLPPPLDRRLSGALTDIASTGGAFLSGLARAFATRSLPPPLADFDAALRAYHAGIAALRQEGAFRGLPADAPGRVFALGFALDQLRQNTADLADRAREFARDTKAGPLPTAGA
jgi:uncharacterized membrane protein YccC